MASDPWLNKVQRWSLTPEEVNFIVLGLKDWAEMCPDTRLKRSNLEMATKLELQLSNKIRRSIRNNVDLDYIKKG